MAAAATGTAATTTASELVPPLLALVGSPGSATWLEVARPQCPSCVISVSYVDRPWIRECS